MGLLQQTDGAGDGNESKDEGCGKGDLLGSPTSGSGDSVQPIYYGIYIPEVTESRVYTDRSEALRTLKSNKTARFKAFSDEKAAVNFSANGSETIVKWECPNLPASPTVSHAEGSNYKAPKSQELVKFRKAIEKHDFAYVSQCVEDNPRYLVSSGDTPQILQEGSRYNALHIASRANNAQVTRYICETVKSVEFMNKLYGGANSNLADRGTIMLDLYLNTPDKGSNETPLHFASKLGAFEVVRVLVTYDQCDRRRTNKFGYTARDLVCSRASGLPAESDVRKEILFALEDHYYVAVLRSPDNALAPTIAEPFSPSTPPPFLDDCSTPKKSNRFHQPMVVSGVAGPMTASEATTFRKKWKTPPRKLITDSSSASPVVTDPEKGFERVGRALATDFQVKWKEYWAFLGEFVDLQSPEGLDLLENYLKEMFEPSSSKKPSSLHKTEILPSAVVSPITDLCNNFKSLAIDDDRPKVSPSCLDNSSAVFATRLALSLSRGLTSALHEIERYQQFLEGCSNDRRFSLEDLSTAHSRLASLVHARLQSTRNDNCSEFVSSVLHEKTDNCSKSSFDCLKCVLNFVQVEGQTTTSCNCPVGTKNNNRLANSVGRNLNLSGFGRSYDDWDDFDSDEEKDEFFTPPSSPVQFDNDDDDDDFQAATDAPEVFIEGGSQPGKVDFDVYRTLAPVLSELPSSQYPSIYFWSHCVAQHSFPTKQV